MLKADAGYGDRLIVYLNLIGHCQSFDSRFVFLAYTFQPTEVGS